MLACLRSAQFYYPDYSGSVVVELRRHHDIYAQCDNKAFLVTKRLTRLPHVIIQKSFGTYAEACRYWDEQVHRVEDLGLIRRDAKIIGFHEEG
jgi:predicted membrane-bound mannosyltransferase